MWQAMQQEALQVPVVALVTQVLVDSHDPAFTHPTKPIGPFYTKEVAERYFSQAAMVVSGAGGRRRIVFPVPILVHAESLDVAMKTAGSACSMTMLAGHVWVWGWVVGLHTAMKNDNTALVRALWEAALTETLQLRIRMTDTAKAAATIAESELRKTQDRIAGDSFVSFAVKCCLIFEEASHRAASKGKLLAELGVMYGGATVSRAMLTVILYFTDRFDSRAIDIFRSIEYKHGRDVISGAYSKLSRLGALCGTLGVDSLSFTDVACYFLEYLQFALDYEIMAPRDVTAEWLDKQKDGTPGAVATVISRQQ
jgi:hypothetical protein